MSRIFFMAYGGLFFIKDKKKTGYLTIFLLSRPNFSGGWGEREAAPGLLFFLLKDR